MTEPGQGIMASAGTMARVPEWDPRLLWYTLGLVALLLLGAYVIWLTDRWRKRSRQPEATSGDQLAHFRRLYERGEFSAEEFARIRGLLTDRLMKEMEKPGPPAPESAARPEPPVPAPPPDSPLPP